MSPVIDFGVTKDFEGVVSIPTPIFQNNGFYGNEQRASVAQFTLATIPLSGNGLAIGFFTVLGTTANGASVCYFTNTTPLIVRTTGGTPTILAPVLPLAPLVGVGALGASSLTVTVSGLNLLLRVTPGSAAATNWKCTGGSYQEASL